MELNCKILQTFGTISEKGGEWRKEFNKIEWNGKAAKYDIRDWNGDHTNCSKGITLSEDEVQALYGILKGILE